jgi:hypothetical protein
MISDLDIYRAANLLIDRGEGTIAAATYPMSPCVRAQRVLDKLELPPGEEEAPAVALAGMEETPNVRASQGL